METENNFPIINQHATWIGINPVQGCPKRCKYCFLQSLSKTGVKPEKLVTEKETIRLLKESKYYNTAVPLSFFTNTDAFATKSNMKYLKNLLELCDEQNIFNVKTFITKCYIPDEYIEYFTRLQKKGHKIIVYLSYSGLDATIERGVIHGHIRENFRRLYESGIPIIHYWRPFAPQNSSKEKLDEILGFVSKFATSSVIAGLKVEDKYIEKLNFWPEIKERKNEVLNSEGVWPETVLEYFSKIPSQFSNYPIYQSNSCAIANALSIPDLNAFNGTSICKFNNCPAKQRDLCNKYYAKVNFDSIRFIKAMEKLGYNINDVSYKLTEENEIIIYNVAMTVAEQSYINQSLNKRVIVQREKSDIYWNTSVNGSKPLEI